MDKSITYFQHLVGLRIGALVGDGYYISSETALMDGQKVYVLRHANGARISLFVDYVLGTMRQFRNSRLTYNGNISA